MPARSWSFVGGSECGQDFTAVLGALPPNAELRGSALEFDWQDLLTFDPASAAERPRGCAIAFIPQDPFSSFNPLFTIGDQIQELLRWKSPDCALGRQQGLLLDPHRQFDRTYLFISHGRAVVRLISHRIAVMYLAR